MKPNVVTSLLMGCALLAMVGVVGWGTFFLIELTYRIMGDAMKYLIAGPLLLFVAYLVGNGYLELKSPKG